MSTAGPTPLVALEAVALDVETTGLDPRTDRIVQIAAVPVRGGGIVDAETYRTLVDPGRSIPDGAAAVHGLRDADVAGAPDFRAVAAALANVLGDRPVVGHAIGFDLAVLKAEHARAGLEWREPVAALDTRLLARLAHPGRPAADLEGLAARLDVAVEARHTALGDARTAARVFLALLGPLRRRGIRTLGEALRACAGLAAPDDHAAISAPARLAALSEAALSRIDAYPYRHTAGQAMSAPPLTIRPQATLEIALGTMAERRVSSLFVCDSDPPVARGCGIVTERDVLRALSCDGAAALAHPVGDIMSRPLETVAEDVYLYHAIARMTRLGVRHLGVCDAYGRLVGALTQRDLLRLRAGGAAALDDEIEHAADAAALAAAWAKIPKVVQSLVDEDVPGREICAVIARELGAMTRAAAIIAERRLGPPPAPYALLLLGSGGRGESLLAPDQDNALIHGQTADEEWFSSLGGIVRDILDEAGIPLCRGGVMAANAEWRGTVDDWRRRIDDWTRRQRPGDLLNVDIFFDFRAVHGDAAMADEVRAHALRTGRARPDFLKLLAESSVHVSPPIGFLGGFVTDDGRLDLKKHGLFPIVAAARVLALAHGIDARTTPARLDGVRAAAGVADEDLGPLSEAHGLFVNIVLSQQLADIAQGISPSGRIAPGRLSRRRASALKAALKGLRHIDTTVRDLLF